MLDDLRAGSRDAVVLYHQDPLTRRPTELEQFVDVVTVAGVRHVKFVSGPDVDVANGDVLLLRVIGAVAANESATKSRRVKRKLEANAAEGKPHGGAWAAYGCGRDQLTVVESEARDSPRNRPIWTRNTSGSGQCSPP